MKIPHEYTEDIMYIPKYNVEQSINITTIEITLASNIIKNLQSRIAEKNSINNIIFACSLTCIFLHFSDNFDKLTTYINHYSTILL